MRHLFVCLFVWIKYCYLLQEVLCRDHSELNRPMFCVFVTTVQYYCVLYCILYYSEEGHMYVCITLILTTFVVLCSVLRVTTYKEEEKYILCTF